MQTDTADASNSKQKLQHWINKNQISKKKSLSTKTGFRKTAVKQKGKKTHYNRSKIHNTGKYGREG